MIWRLALSDYKPRVAIFVSKHDHCLDLLYHHRTSELAYNIPLIISNRPDTRGDAEFCRIPQLRVQYTDSDKSLRVRYDAAVRGKTEEP